MLPKQPTREQRQRADTALHEAGHAVIAARLGVGFRYVTIRETKTSDGHVAQVALPGREPKSAGHLDHYFVTMLAGPEAARRANAAGRRDRRGASDDYLQVARTVETHLICEPVIRAHLVYLVEWTKAIVSVEKASILTLAEHLFCNPTLHVPAADVKSIRATPASVEGRKEEVRKMKFSKRAEEVWRLAR
jgi:hypothetical protein